MLEEWSELNRAMEGWQIFTPAELLTFARRIWCIISTSTSCATVHRCFWKNSTHFHTSSTCSASGRYLWGQWKPQVRGSPKGWFSQKKMPKILEIRWISSSTESMPFQSRCRGRLPRSKKVLETVATSSGAAHGCSVPQKQFINRRGRR